MTEHLNDVTNVFRDVKLTLDYLCHGMFSNHAPYKFLKIISAEKFSKIDVTLNLHIFCTKTFAECFKSLLVTDFNDLKPCQEVIRKSQKYHSRVPRPQVDLGTTLFVSKRRTSKIFKNDGTREGLWSHIWVNPEYS